MDKLYVVKAENLGDLTINLTFSDNTTPPADEARTPRAAASSDDIAAA